MILRATRCVRGDGVICWPRELVKEESKKTDPAKGIPAHAVHFDERFCELHAQYHGDRRHFQNLQWSHRKLALIETILSRLAAINMDLELFLLALFELSLEDYKILTATRVGSKWTLEKAFAWSEAHPDRKRAAAPMPLETVIKNNIERFLKLKQKWPEDFIFSRLADEFDPLFLVGCEGFEEFMKRNPSRIRPELRNRLCEAERCFKNKEFWREYNRIMRNVWQTNSTSNFNPRS